MRTLCLSSGMLLLLLIGMLSSGIFCQAQEQSFFHYDTRDGLAGSVVHGINQDRDGFIWFGTETGLSRFDGKHFRNYTRNDGLPSNEVFQTYIDSKNRLWIVSFKNAICYYHKGIIYNQQNDSQLKQLHLNCQIERVFETFNGEIFLKMADNSYYLLPKDPRQPITFIPAWPAYSPGLSEKLRLLPHKLPLPIFSANPLIRRKEARDSAYFCGFRGLPGTPGAGYVFRTREGLCLLSENGRQSQLLPKADLMFCKLLRNGLLALVSNRFGVRFYDPDQQVFVAEYLMQHKVHDAFQDREGNLWFSTNGSGVYRLNNPAIRDYSFGQPQQPAAVHHIFRYKGLLQVVVDYGSCKELVPANKGGADSLYRIRPGKFSMDKVIASPGQLMHFSNALSDSLFPGWQLHRNMVKTLFYQRDTLYTANAFLSFNLKVSTRQILDTLLPSRSTCVYPWDNTVYIGTVNGLYTYKNGQLDFVGDQFPLFRNRISTMTVSADSTLWIGTYEEGVIGFKGGRIIAKITERGSQLSSNICRCLFASGPYLWIGTEKGINKVDISKGAYPIIARYTVADGLQSDIINALYTEGHMVYAGTQTGLTVFDERTVPRQGPCAILFTGMLVSGKRKQDLPERPLTVAHKDNNIRFEFAGISFLSAGNISYRYRLLGLQEQWQLTEEPFVSYPSLPSGDYIFQIKAINKFGTESTLLEQKVTVLPLFWERRGVQAAGILLLLLLSWLLFQVRIRNVRKKDREQQEVRKQMMDLEQMALRAQMNPHFIFNCLNSIQHFVLNSDGRSANFYITRFAALVRSTLENAPRMYISLQEELDYLKSYIELERMQLAPAFRYTINVATGIDTTHVPIPNMVIQPLVENAIKHGVAKLGADGLIVLQFSKELSTGNIICSVTDNGPGILSVKEKPAASATGHQSKGIAITGERIHILNQLSDSGKQINLKTEWAYEEAGRYYGTRITLVFPDKL